MAVEPDQETLGAHSNVREASTVAAGPKSGYGLLQDFDGSFNQVSDQLDRRIDQLSVKIGRQASEMHRQMNIDMHATMRHLDTQFAARLIDLQAEIERRLADMQRQLSERLGESIHGTMSHVDRHLSSLIINERNQMVATGQPNTEIVFLKDPDAEDQIRRLGRCLQLEAVASHHLVRVGGDADGGYLLLDDFGEIETAFSFGVGEEISWDLDMAGRGLAVHQFDHTIESAPWDHELIQFHRIRIAPFEDIGAEPFASVLRYAVSEKPVIVKMDIEGDEWLVLEQLAESDADQIKQLVCEFHNFDRIVCSADFERSIDLLEKLRNKFGVLHVHANNYGKIILAGNVLFPEILEVSFVNRKYYDLEPMVAELPSPLDRPNRNDIAEITLGSFRY